MAPPTLDRRGVLRLAGASLVVGIGTTATAAETVRATGRTVYVSVHSGGFSELLALDVETGDETWRSDGQFERVYAPIVADGLVYFASANDGVYALDAETGTRVWHFEDAARFVATPTVFRGRAYVGTRNGKCYALDAETGEKEWVFDEPSDFGGVTQSAEVSTPAVVEDLAFLTAPAEGTAYALDVESGGEQWRFERTGAWMRRGPVAEGRLFLTTRRHPGSSPEEVRQALYAVDATTGSREWTADELSTGPSRPVVDDGYVFVRDEGTVYAFDAETGERHWTVESDVTRFVGTPTVTNGVVFVCRRGEDEDRTAICALAAETGEEMWQFDDHESASTLQPPTVTDSTLYTRGIRLGGDDDTLYALDPETGAEQWRIDLPGTVFRQVTVVEDPASHSVDSTVTLGAIAHHDIWVGSDALDGAHSGDEHSRPVRDDNGSDPDSEGSAGGDEFADDDGAGFGPGIATAGFGCISYLLRRATRTEASSSTLFATRFALAVQNHSRLQGDE